MLTDVLHHLVPLLDQHQPDATHQLVDLLAPHRQPTPPPPTPGGPDFSKITPDARGVPKSGVMFTIGQVILYFGLGVSFIVLLCGLVTWASGHLVSGIHLSQNAKSHMLRAGFTGIALTTAGGLWTWITSVS
ncbi:MAG: hypothetical protein WBA97_12160 [Actinophytocola sp.]|uniref:hypothetical protein n=1 Tax=Actinophytocola sp. TaxID=1872138 RepID=UPI003C706424